MYFIKAVRFNAAGTHIDFLRCQENQGQSLGPEQSFSRQSVIDAINKGTTFMTMVKNSQGQFARGQMIDVHPMTVHYLKTRPDSSLKDNLDNLPTF